jgi:ATP-dependent DNA helicase PIF1
MRLRDSPANEAFANWIGRMSYDRSLYGSVELPKQVDVTSSLQSLIDHVYPLPTITQADENTTFFKGRSILCTRNDAANAINDTVLRRLGGRNAEERVYESADRAAEDDNGLAADLPPAYLASLSLSGLPLASLRLRKGAPVMLLRNLYTQHGLCNGTRVVIVRLLRHGVVDPG